MPFIAHVRRDVPALLAHIRELQQELTQAYEELAMYQRHVYQGVPPENLRRFYRDVDQELARAMERYPRMNSAHEAYAVILEELEELWQEIKVKQARHDHAAMRREAVQIAAMVTRFVIDVLEVQE
jgi:phage terminase small subunit